MSDREELFEAAAAKQTEAAKELDRSLNALAMVFPAPVLEHHRGLLVAYLKAVEETIRVARR